MPAKTVTVYQCDRCHCEETEGGTTIWQGVIIPTTEPTTAGQQLLCPDCTADAKAFMENHAVITIPAAA